MTFVVEWLELAVRWIHVIAGVTWIGTSFYFNWLNERLSPPERPEPGVVGELWSVHGGGFYRSVKYEVAPARLPDELHWFKWEAYLTWLSGASLLILVYYLGAEVYMVDAGVRELSPWVAIAIGVGTIIGGWVVYNALCHSPMGRRPGWFAAVGLLGVTGLAYALLQFVGPRAAYIHVGSMLGTIMVANVAHVIIPNQRRMVAALSRGQPADAAEGRQAATRSLHNNYLTLPVLFVMVSNHYPITYGHPLAWAILAGLFVVGVVTRHAFNLRNRGRPAGWLLPTAAVAMVALGWVTAGTRAAPPGDALADDPEGPIDFARARAIIVARCTVCHAETPTNDLFAEAPGGILLETPEQIQALTDRIYETSVLSKIMPLGNFTEMTDEERAQLGRWIDAGAVVP